MGAGLLPSRLREVLGGSWYLLTSQNCTHNCTYNPIRALKGLIIRSTVISAMNLQVLPEALAALQLALARRQVGMLGR